MLRALNCKAVDHGCLLCVDRIIAAINVGRLGLYHHAREASYHVNV